MKANKNDIIQLLHSIPDPEVPVISIMDLGIVRDVVIEDDKIEIIITPTYSGCPAMDAISMNIRLELISHGYTNIKITSVLSPAWTTEWMSETGKEKLRTYGIAPPNARQQFCNDVFAADETVQCPKCNSSQTSKISEFGSTACKSLYQCRDCLEPFDYFKCH
ncbi:MAG: phenylacetate-CoA oxygenase subunit PaaJ [Chitinophagaceae bacterium]|nr:phenylacetate-CoA oxygenase subunit PaaJ [Chitinophagaceae bacterium]